MKPGCGLRLYQQQQYCSGGGNGNNLSLTPGSVDVIETLIVSQREKKFFAYLIFSRRGLGVP
jgi:hypothetical protein